MVEIARVSSRRAALLAPLGVAVAVGALLFWSSAASLRPAFPVRVRPALLVEPARAPDQAPGGALATPTVRAPGWLEADPYIVACTALADGIVDEILVLEGERVEAGQVVARLVAADAELAFARAQAQLAGAEATLLAAGARLRAAQSDWENPTERERAVDATAAELAEIDAELAQLPALILRDESTLVRLEEELARMRDAHGRGAVTDLELIIQEKQTVAQGASLDALKKREAILVAKQRRLTAEKAAADRNAVLRIEERLALDSAVAEQARAGAELQRASVEHATAQLRLDRMTIRAPISGLVQRRLKIPGDKVMLAMDSEHSAHLLHLFDPANIQVRVDVPLADVAHVRVGQAAEVVVDVLPETPFRSVVTRITHEADLQKNTLEVKVAITDPSPMLKPEMLTRVTFVGTDTARPARPDREDASLRVPVEAIVGAGDDRRVWAVRDRRDRAGVARSVPVTVVKNDGTHAVVRGALVQGELLVVGSMPTRPGQRVRVEAIGGDA